MSEMHEFITTVFHVYQTLNATAQKRNDKRMAMISLLIINYARNLAEQNGVDLTSISPPTSINLMPFFEYVSKNQIEIIDFSKVNINDIDTNKPADLERYVLSHIYHITQQL